MLLHCLTPFPTGTKVTVNQRQYHFLENKFGHAVADVLDKDVETILSIGAGYQKYAEPTEEELLDEEDNDKGEDVFDELNPDFARAATTAVAPKPAVGSSKPKPLRKTPAKSVAAE